MSKEQLSSTNSENAKKLFMKLAAMGSIVLATAACSTTEKEAERYKEDQVDGVAAISICNEAKLRDTPTVYENNGGDTNLIDTVDFGDLPEDFCVSLPIPEGTTVMITDDIKPYADANGPWIGIPENVASSVLPEADLNDDDVDNMVWISMQKASFKLSSDDQQQS